jgi:hypothetical protein
MSEVMSEEVKPVEQPRSWFGWDSVLVPLVTATYMGALTQLGVLIEHPTVEQKVCVIVALVAPMVFPVGILCEELSAKWKKRKA